jgi:histidinol-phosphate/aromatic aminotransferase/cobyric acid decarboxylase-like protein
VRPTAPPPAGPGTGPLGDAFPALLPGAGPHGGDGAAVAAALGLDPAGVLDLSASLNPFAPPVARLVAEAAGAVGRYPDTRTTTASLADALGVERERLLLTNGGAEAIALVATDLARGWSDPCEFSLYRRHLPVLDPAGPRFCSDPHNPTGRLAPAGTQAEVWDEAFYPLATGRWTARRAGVVVGSLTKVFACPGLRMGYVIGDPELVDRLARRQPAWAVNSIASAVLPILLEEADLPAWRRRIARLRTELADLLGRAGLQPDPADANWVLCRRAPGLRAALAPHGVVVRDCASFGLEGAARVAVPGPDGLQRVEGALAAAGYL